MIITLVKSIKEGPIISFFTPSYGYACDNPVGAYWVARGIKYAKKNKK